MKRLMIICLLVLFAVPVFAVDIEGIGSVFTWMGEVLANKTTWSVAGVLSVISAYYWKDVDVEAVRRKGSRHGFLGGRFLSIRATAVPWLGKAWEIIIEKWVVKIWTLLTAYITALLVAFPVGLASDNNQKEPEK